MSTTPLRIVLELALPKEIGYPDATAMSAQIVRALEQVETAVGDRVGVHHALDRVIVEEGYAVEEAED